MAENKMEGIKMAENKVVESKMEGTNMAESKMEESKMEGIKMADSKMVEARMADSKMADSKMAGAAAEAAAGATRGADVIVGVPSLGPGTGEAWLWRRRPAGGPGRGRPGSGRRQGRQHKAHRARPGPTVNPRDPVVTTLHGRAPDVLPSHPAASPDGDPGTFDPRPPAPPAVTPPRGVWNELDTGVELTPAAPDTRGTDTSGSDSGTMDTLGNVTRGSETHTMVTRPRPGPLWPCTGVCLTGPTRDPCMRTRTLDSVTSTSSPMARWCCAACRPRAMPVSTSAWPPTR
ncbi:mucin-2-like [Dipodomys spectabilis]|uniref:mucin-2-like n=1 Tax=Dipodomys spectabilis TaxID=105255 RepID=UPI001C537FB2|nr:mucin-2-like [Dipodomys spectabilis]